MNMTLQCKETTRPHPEGIHPAVCVDVIDLGRHEVEFQGRRRLVNKLKLLFETEQRSEDGKACFVSRNFTASLHPKAKLAAFLGRWRGRPVVPGETIELTRLVGASCTLVISHQQSHAGETYASIDAVSKPTKKVLPSGQYDPAATRQRLAEWRARDSAPPAPPNPAPALATTPPAPPQAPNLSAPPASATQPDFDPEVGF